MFEEIVEKNPQDVSLKILARELDRLNRKPVLKYQKLDPEVNDPIHAKEGDMCFDIFAHGEPTIKETYIEYQTGLRFEIPEGYDMLIYPRSSISNYDLVLANSVGVVDNLYRGTVLVRFKIIVPIETRQPKIYLSGDKICQAVLVPKTSYSISCVEEISTDTARGEGGFGSSGK